MTPYFARLAFGIFCWSAISPHWIVATADETPAIESDSRVSNSTEANWPGWGGPKGDGHSVDSRLPTAWGANDLAWKVVLPGVGQSAPCVWGDSIYLTAALEDGRQRVVFCLDRKRGDKKWERMAWNGDPEPSHPMNGWASATCATDGEIVVAFFGKGGIHAYDPQGTPLWSKDLGAFVGPWGTAACPVIHGDLVIQNCDSDQDAYIVALDKRNGEIKWRTPRETIRGWSTPLITLTERGPELILNGHHGPKAYDPSSGRELWTCKSFNGRGEPVPARYKNTICVVNGLRGDIYAVELGGQGDVTSTRMAWHTPRKTDRDLPSPIVVGEYLLVIDRKGILTCYQAATGSELWQERLGGNYSASPIEAGGKVYYLAEDGVTSVVEPGPAITKVARNDSLADGAQEEVFRAAIAPSQGQLLIRSSRCLYCVGATASSASAAQDDAAGRGAANGEHSP